MSNTAKSVGSKFKAFWRNLQKKPVLDDPASVPRTQDELRRGTATLRPTTPEATTFQLMTIPDFLSRATDATVPSQETEPTIPAIELATQDLIGGPLPSDIHENTSLSHNTLSVQPRLELASARQLDTSSDLVIQPAGNLGTIGINESSLWSRALEKLPGKSLDDLDRSNDGNLGLVHRLIKEAEDKKAKCDADRFYYTDSRGEKVFYAEAFLTQLNKYAAIGDIALQHHPDVVALAWAGFRLLLQVGTAYTDNMAMVSSSLGYLVSVIFCGEIYDKLYCRMQLKAAEQLALGLVDLYASILEYLLCANQYLQKNSMIRIVESFSSKLSRILNEIQSRERAARENADIAEKEAASTARSDQNSKIKDLRRHLRELQEQIQGIEETVVDCHKKIQDICDFVDNEYRTKALDWVSKVEYGGHHLQHHGRRVAGTGDWLRENPKFLAWISGASKQILWLRGDAGSGKTMLASKVIDILENEHDSESHAVAYFYCHYQEKERYMPESILRAIVKQLCVAFSEDGLPKCLTDIYDKRQRKGNSTGALKIDESEKLIIDLSRLFVRTTIVIDALDECDTKTRRDLFSRLNGITDAGHCIHLFVTGRSEGDIRDGLLGSPDHYINAQDNSKDITIYIKSGLDRLCKEKPLLAPELDKKKKEIIERLEQRAEGMFMWVHLRMKAISDETTIDGVFAALDETPADLHKFYFNILARITKQSPTDSRGAEGVLKWLAYSHGACSPETVGQALSVASRMVPPGHDFLLDCRQIIDICRNLVIYDEKLKVLRFAHYTVKEFLRDREVYDKKKGNTWIAKICLTILDSDRHENTLVSTSPTSPLLEYATYNWASHLKQSNQEDSGLMDLWKSFLTPSSKFYRLWVSEIVFKSDFGSLESDGEGPIHPFWVACYFQLRNVYEHLLKDGAPPNCRNWKHETPLHHAAEQGDEDLAKLLIREPGIDINSKDNRNVTPLIQAAINGHTNVAQLLLKDKEIDVNWQEHALNTALSQAARNGHTEIVCLLLQRTDTMLNEQDHDGDTALSTAVSANRGDVVKVLLDKDGVDVNRKRNTGDTALSIAVTNGHLAIVQCLLGKNGLEINCVDGNGNTPLLVAARDGHLDILKRLLGMENVDVGFTNVNGNTPLLLAVEGDHKQVVQHLLDYGVDPNERGGSGDTPLLRAVLKNNLAIAELLMSKPDVDVNSVSGRSGFTALSRAIWFGYEDIANLLLERHGVDLNHQDDDGDTPLLLAIYKGSLGLVEKLLEKEGVDIDYRDTREKLLSLASTQFEAQGDERFVKVLLDKGYLDINSAHSFGRTLLRYATLYGNASAVRLLLSYEDVKVAQPSGHGTTPLLDAAENGYTECFKLLLARYGAGRITDMDHDGDTLLLVAAAGGKAEIVQLVLDRGEEDINCRNKAGFTPLIMAVRGGTEEVARLLLKQPGIDVGATDGDGQTALDWARMRGYQTLVELLSTYSL